MSRKLILAAATTLLFTGTDVVALGLGEIRAYSGLNQPFQGEIALYDVKPEDQDSIQIALASQAAFDQAGIERYYDLTKLKFTLTTSASGETVITVTSREPIREPYLDMLVEVYWPQGQLVKEYTVLLEPAERMTQPAKSPATPSRASSAANSTAATASAAAAGGAFPLMIGPVERGAGLWQLARANAPAGATVAQTALALYRNNQDAFTRGNINRLVSGKMLMIPTREELLALDPQTAEREFATARRGGAVSRAPLTAVPDMAQLRIVGAKPSAAAPAAGAATGNPRRLEQDVLIALETTESNRQEAQELRGRIRELETQLATIQQLLEQRDLTAAPAAPGVLGTAPVAAEPVTALAPDADAPLATPPSVAEVVSPNPPDAVPSAVPVGAETPPVPLRETTAPAADVAPLPLPAADAAAPIAPPKPVVTAPVITAAADADQPEEASIWHALMLPLAGLAGLSALGILGFAWMASRRQAAKLSEKEVALDALDTENDEYFDNEPTAFLTSGASNTAALSSLNTDGQPIGASERSDSEEEPETPMSLMSSLSDFDVETDAVDPLSEADVYMVYGRHDEAQALLLKEMQRFPNRLDIKFKLAEACIGTKNVQGLNSVMASIEALGGDRSQAQQWQRLQDLAAPLLHPENLSTTEEEETFPDSFLINLNKLPPSAVAPAPPPAPTPAPVTETHETNLADLDFDIDALLPDSEPTPLLDMPSKFAAKDTEPNDSQLLMTDIQRAVIRGNEPTAAPLVKPPSAALPLSFDDDELGKLLSTADPLLRDPRDPPVQTAAPVQPAPAPIAAVPLPDVLDLDLDLNIGEPPPPPVLPLTKPKPSASMLTDGPDSELVLMLDDPRLEQLEDLNSIIAAANSETPRTPPLEPVSDTTWQMNSGAWDETATKLDLAQAYADMDDPDAARDILNEVLAEGNVEQQAAAQRLLDRIK